MSSVKKNFIYMVIYHILTLLIPIITSPFLARTLGAEGIGIYSYSYSIVSYFMMFTLLGVNNYGNRRIAMSRDDKNKLSFDFWNIYSMQFIFGIFMLLIYTIFVLFFDISYKSVFIINYLFILSAILDINWFFFGIEKFKVTILRNTLLKFLNLVLIILFIRNTSDVVKYTLIMSVMTFLSQLLMWSYLFKEIKFNKPSIKEIIKHLKPNFVLFIPVIAVSLYKIMDKIMLGKMTSVIIVGYYENAEKIINIPATLITALGLVMLPRISNLVSKGNNNKIREYIEKSIKLMMFLSFPIMFGLITISENFIPFFLGSEFKNSIILIMMLSTTIPIVSFANVIRTQYLIPKGKDNVFLISSIMGAIVNIILNIIFIPKYNAVGACIGTFFAELVVLIYQLYKVKNDLDLKKYLFITSNFLFKSFIMFIIIYPINFFSINKIVIIILQIIIGALIYFILNLSYINEIIDFKKVLKKFLKKAK